MSGIGTERRRGTSGPILALALAVAVLAAPSLDAQQGRGQLTGELLYEDGSPVAKVQLLLTPTGGGGPVKIKTDGRGRFSHGYLASGRYVIGAKDENVFLRRFEVVIKEPTGVELNRWASDAHPDSGLPPVQVMFGLKTHVDIVVGDAADRARVRQALAVAEVSGPMQSAMDLYDSGDMEATIAECERILAEQPEVAFGHFLHGMALSRVGKLPEAEAAMRQALRIDAELPDVAGALGTLLLERAQRAQAAGEGETAKAKYAEAAELIQKQLGQAPTPALRSNLVMALDRSGQKDAAIALLEQLIEAEPDNAPYYYHLADLYRQTEGGEEKALALLERVPETETSSADVMYNIAVQHFNSGEYDEALEILDRAMGVDPDFALLYHLKGRIFLARSDYEGAAREMGRFIEMDPENPLAEEDRQIVESLAGMGGGS